MDWKQEQEQRLMGSAHKRNDILNEWDRAQVGAFACQLRMPLDDPTNILDYLDMIEGMVNRCRIICRNDNLSVRSKLMDVRSDFRGVQWSMDRRKEGGYQPHYGVIRGGKS